MSLTTISQSQGLLPQLFAISVLLLGYYNYVLIDKPVRFFFEISSLTGKVLVNKFLALCNCIWDVLKLAQTFFQILYEDLLIFVKDATEKFTFAIYLFKELYLLLEGIAWSLLKYVLEAGKTFLCFLEFICHTLVTLKQGICLTGSSIWDFFTSLPGTVVSAIFGITDFMKYTFNEIISTVIKLQEKVIQSVDKVYSLLFDIPLDSIYGLIIGAVLVSVLCVKFKDICYLSSSAVLKLYRQAIILGINLWSGRFLEQENRRYMDYSPDDDERLCIVCQYHPKEIILLPCRHLCLCFNCTKELSGIQPVCPICRSNITETYKVYM